MCASHPFYSPDLEPCNFPKIENCAEMTKICSRPRHPESHDYIEGNCFGNRVPRIFKPMPP